MPLIELDSTAIPNSAPTDKTTHREVLRLSDLDAGIVADMSNMFGVWFETDHCDKDVN